MTIDATGVLYGNWGRTRKVCGAGGFGVRLVQAQDGTKVITQDVGRAYYRKPSDPEWTCFLRMNDNFTPTGIHYTGNYASAICWSNPLIMYSIIGGELWKTVDGGQTVTLCSNWPNPGNGWANDQYNKSHGNPLEVDPNNGNNVWYGDPVNGIMYSQDGGGSWTTIPLSVIPSIAYAGGDNKGCYPYTIKFDRTSAVVGGITQGMYIHSYGSGLYHSPDGGKTWALMTGSPTVCSCLAIGTDGVLHLIGPGTGLLTGPYSRYMSGAWTTNNSVVGQSVSCSTLNPGHIYAATDAGVFNFSFDNGTTWAYNNTNNYAHPIIQGSDIAWFNWTNEWYMSHGRQVIDPVTDNICIAEGIGYFEVAPITSVPSGSIYANGKSKGIESIVTQNINVRNDGRAFISGMDRPCFMIEDANAGINYPAYHAYLPGNPHAIQHAGDADFCPFNQNIVYACIYDPINDIASQDGGGTWYDVGTSLQSAFAAWQPSRPPDQQAGWYGSGNVALLSDQIWLRVLSAKGGLWRTPDGGKTWTRIIIGDDSDLNCHYTYWSDLKLLAADKYQQGRAIINWVGGSGNPADPAYAACGGVWETVDWGQSFQRIHVGSIAPNQPADFWHGKLRQRSATEWWFWGCNGNNYLMRSLDKGHTWNAVNGNDSTLGAYTFSQVNGVGFGPPMRAGEPGVIYVEGWRMAGNYNPTDYSGYGTWLSRDDGANWVRIAGLGPDIPYSSGSTGCGDPSNPLLFYTGNTTEAATVLRFTDKRKLIGSTAPINAIAFDPANKAANIALSNANHTVTNTTASGNVAGNAKGINSHSTGKWHFAYHIDKDNATTQWVSIGIGWANATLTDPVWVSMADWVFAMAAYGNAQFHGGTVHTTPTFTTGATVECAVDLSVGLAWFAIGGSWLNGTPGVSGGWSFNTGQYWPMVWTHDGDIVTAVDIPPPAGFSAWV